MSLDLWFAFAAASAVMLLIPGPTALLVASYALSHGRRSSLMTVAGVVAGDFISLTLSLAGLGALLAASATLFTVLKFIGAAYLIWLGVKLWRSDANLDAAAADVSGGRMFGLALLVTAFNPKGITFFVAFLPQFLDSTAPLLPQMIVVEITFLALSACNVLFYAFMAARARRAIRRPQVLRVVNRIGGSLLVGAGIAAFAVKRA
jgi:threonine/homoserine/homoserine lactone efflux protein